MAVGSGTGLSSTLYDQPSSAHSLCLCCSPPFISEGHLRVIRTVDGRRAGAGGGGGGGGGVVIWRAPAMTTAKVSWKSTASTKEISRYSPLLHHPRHVRGPANEPDEGVPNPTPEDQPRYLRGEVD